MDNYFKASDILDKAFGTDAYFQIKSILLGTKTADVVPKAAYDQVVWERDMAVFQLRADYGVGLGEKKADVAPVRHGRWVKRQNPQWKAYYHDACSICGWWNTKNSMCYNGKKKPGHSLNYCPNCGARMGKEDEHETG